MTEGCGYVELHARSAFSFLRGASLPEELAAEAAALGLSALALCDRDGVYGAPRLYGAGREHGIRALVGCELTLADGSALPVLVADRTGYRNLCRLITTTKLTDRPSDLPFPDARERKRPCYASWSELGSYSEGLIALTGDAEGPVVRALQSGGEAAAELALEPLRTIFGPDRLFVEVQRHRIRGEARTEGLLTRLADRHHLPLLATGGVDYAKPDSREVADVFTCLRHHTTLDAAGRLLAPNSGRHLRSPEEMQVLFSDRPDLVKASVHLAGRITFTLRDLGYAFPSFPVPADETMETWLRRQTFAGARERFPELTDKHQHQIERELALITKLGFCGYFLIVWDICRWARERGILVQGRGSAANSAVCYALGITAVDPIRQKLLFERFLSEGRVGVDGHPSWPDIDLDLPSGELRESVIQEVYRRYAPRGAAMTANVITYRGRSTARELGKVLGLPDDILDRFSSLFARGDFPHTVELEDQLAQSGLSRNHPRLPALARLYRRMKGLPRHLGQHSGGMVICAGDLDGVVPLEPATMPGRVVVQWDKDDCEDLGIVKVDFLGLGMMAALQDAFKLCASGGGPSGLHEIPQDDRATFDAMCRADTIGVFQIESRAQMSTLPRFKPDTFYDVAMQVAIVRPGPIVGKLVHPLIRRRARKETDVYIDESLNEILKPVLERTHGVVLFQEQMLAVAMILAGFSGAEAEELRRGMGFHRSNDRLERVLIKLRLALQARGHPPVVADKVIETACSFALYGFPESHALSFALLAYASTWLKVHRPAIFCACLLNHQPMGFYSPATLVQDARRHGVRIKPVCVVESDWNCTVENADTLRIGLNYVKGVRRSAAEKLLATRRDRSFRSLDDFLARTPFTAAERRALASVGALNAFTDHRRAALWQVEAAWSVEESLFLAFDETSGLDPMPLAPMSLAERQQADFAGLALTNGEHPMARIRSLLPDAWRAADLALGRDGETVTVAGSVICRQRPGTAKGVVFVSLEDETGIANVIVRPRWFERYRLAINQEPALLITGKLQHREGVIHVQAETVAALTAAAVPAQASHDFH
ncbi:MAG: error-prone DNA polymerase [Opitutaceae bacterium]|nr:error-prone DNA polymerase [Opitutaceae bacterium]